MEQRRVVITGMGTINPLGCSLESYWEGLTSGRSGIGPVTLFDASDLPCRIAGEVRDFDPHDYMDRKDVRRAPRATHLVIAAASQAMADSGLNHKMPEPDRAGVVLGTGVGGLERIITANQVLVTKGYNRVNPFHLPSAIPNMPAAEVAREFQCLGPNNTITTACAAGTQAIGEAMELIRRGAADIMLTGGTEAIVLEIAFGAFSVMRALPFNFNDRPEEASRPFDADREGFVLSEGSAILVLEELGHALDRGAQIYAEVAGHASSSDGYHMAAMDPSGSGATRAMTWALADAKIEPNQIDYINAHGTSTGQNDPTETQAIKNVFGEDAYDIPVSSTKSMAGHAMGASGALEAVACTMTITNNIIPPTINYTTPDPECDLNYVPNQPLEKEINYTLSNSFGLGGQNACVVLKSYNGAPA